MNIVAMPIRFPIFLVCVFILPLSSSAQQQKEPETPSIRETVHYINEQTAYGVTLSHGDRLS